jgi:hypothetical protein
MSRQGHALSAGEDAGHLSPDGRRSRQSLRRTLRRRAPRAGERRLALAVLEDAVMRVRRNRRWARLRHLWPTHEAERWVASRKRDRLFSFENVCLILAVDPGEVREWILRGRARPSGPASQGPAYAALWGAEDLRGV